jgi:hypothetical protein
LTEEKRREWNPIEYRSNNNNKRETTLI